MSEVKATVYSPDSATWPPEWPAFLVAVADYDTAIRERDEARAELAKAKETLRDCYEQADGGLQVEHDCPAVFACSCILVNTMEVLGIEPPSAAPAASEPKPDYTCECGYMAAWPICTKCGKPTEAGAGASEARDVILENSCKCKMPTPAPFNGEWCYRCGRPLVQQSNALPAGSIPSFGHCIKHGAWSRASGYGCPGCNGEVERAAPSPAQPEGKV